MSSGEDSLFYPWFMNGMRKPDKTDAGLARALEINPTQVGRMRSGRRQIKASELAAMAIYFDEPLPVVPGLVRARKGDMVFPVTHEIGATLDFHDPKNRKALSPDQAFSHLPHYAARVHSREVDLKVPPGFSAIYVPYFDARTRLTSGDFVIAEAQGADIVSGVKLPIIRRMIIRDAKIALVCASTDMRLNSDMMQLDRKLRDKKAGVTIKIVGLVLYCINPMDGYEIPI